MSAIPDISRVKDLVVAGPPATMGNLIDEMIIAIFSHLNIQDIVKCRLISHRFAELGDDEPLLHKKIVAFGKIEWERYFGEVGKEPPHLPLKLLKEVFKTYILVLIPETIDGNKVTLKLFQALAEKPKGGGYAIKIDIGEKILEKYGDIPGGPSRWLLFPRDILEGTLGKSYPEQLDMVAKKAGHEVTRMLQAVIAMGSRHVHTGERLLSGRYTRCQETINAYYGQLLVGFVPGCLLVDCYFFVGVGDYGVAAVRK